MVSAGNKTHLRKSIHAYKSNKHKKICFDEKYVSICLLSGTNSNINVQSLYQSEDVHLGLKNWTGICNMACKAVAQFKSQ
jgi:hypothetical protein